MHIPIHPIPVEWNYPIEKQQILPLDCFHTDKCQTPMRAYSTHRDEGVHQSTGDKGESTRIPDYMDSWLIGVGTTRKQPEQGVVHKHILLAAWTEGPSHALPHSLVSLHDSMLTDLARILQPMIASLLHPGRLLLLQVCEESMRVIVDPSSIPVLWENEWIGSVVW